MKRVSLKSKVPSLCVLGALGVTFVLSPLGAFAKCGGGQQQQQAAPVASIKSTEKFSECSTRPISAANASKLAADGWSSNTTKNGAKATVGDTTTAPAPAPLTPKQLQNISFMAGNASCSFTPVDPTSTSKVNLQNGDMFLAVLGSDNQPVFGMVVGGKLVFFTGNQNGQHFANVVQNPRVQIDNATVGQPSGK